MATRQLAALHAKCCFIVFDAACTTDRAIFDLISAHTHCVCRGSNTFLLGAHSTFAVHRLPLLLAG